MIDEPAEEKTQERRRFFRIEDEIALFYRQILADEVPETDEFKQGRLDTFSLTAALESLTQESRTQLRKIERSQPEVADFLKILEQKIDLIAQSILLKETESDEQTTRDVNLSASGLAFDVETPLALEGILELKMILPPSLLGIITYGRIIYCKKNELADSNYPYRVGVEFFSLLEQDRELLIRYIFKKQLRQLRESKL